MWKVRSVLCYGCYWIIYLIIDGLGQLKFDNEIYELKKEDTYFIPSNVGKLEVAGKLEILKSYI